MVKKTSTPRRESWIQLLAVLAIVLSTNLLSSKYHLRLDMTAEGRYTLSPSTVKLYSELEDVITVKVYLDGDLPPGFKRLRNSIRELLEDLSVQAGDNLEYEFVDPAAGKDEKARMEVYKQLAKKGLFPTNLEVRDKEKRSEKIVFPGAIFSYRGKELPLQLLKSRAGVSPEEMLNNSIEGLEYEFCNALRKVTRPVSRNIAFLRGHGELPTPEISDAARSLSETYSVDTVEIAERLHALDGYDAIIIARPTLPFSEKDKFIIDQFIMRGGKTLWFIDKMAIDMDSLTVNSTTISIPWNLNIEDQLFRYGVRLNDDLIMDLQSAPIPVVTGYTGNTPRQELFPWPYFPLMDPASINPIVNDLNVVKGEFCSTLDTIQVEGIRKTILLSSSKASKLQMAPARVSLNLLQEPPDPKVFGKKFMPTAALLEGAFTSNFRNRIPESIRTSSEIGFLEKGKPTKMIIVSDGDVIRNFVSKRGAVYPLGYDRYTKQSYGNQAFLLNCVDYLLDDSGVIGLRSKEIRLRLLDTSRLENSESILWLNVLVPLLVISMAGMAFFWLRRKRFGRPRT
ncbi:MAG: gliding motility-associated ABC transporter substrate-binding protein GldG [Bacteroidota bacterium]